MKNIFVKLSKEKITTFQQTTKYYNNSMYESFQHCGSTMGIYSILKQQSL